MVGSVRYVPHLYTRFTIDPISVPFIPVRLLASPGQSVYKFATDESAKVVDPEVIVFVVISVSLPTVARISNQRRQQVRLQG